MTQAGNSTATDRDARREKAEHAGAELSAAKAAMRQAENDLKACDDSIDTHQVALVTHKRALESSKDERKGLVAARKHARAQLSAATATAAKADAKYDKAVLAQLVHDAKDAEQAAAAKKAAPAKRTYTRRAPAKTAGADAPSPVKTTRRAPRASATRSTPPVTNPATPSTD